MGLSCMVIDPFQFLSQSHNKCIQKTQGLCRWENANAEVHFHRIEANLTLYF